MKTTNLLRNLLILSLLSGIAMPAASGNKNNLSKEEVISIARDAYLFATPLIYTDVTRVASPVPDNYLNHATRFPDHTFKHVVAPNNDTNYSSAFLQLGAEPVVVELPDTKGRYYVFPLQDAWTNNFILPGKRTSGTGEQKYLITGPRWKGEVPAGLTQIKSPTDLVWAIGRVQVNSPEDQVKNVVPLQRKFVLKPLSRWLAKDTAVYIASPIHKLYGNYLPATKGKSVVETVKNLSVENFFNYFNELVVDNPSAAADAAVVKEIEKIGVGAGKRFSLADFDKETQEALINLPADVYKEMENVPFGKNLFGKSTTDPAAKLGDYKTDYNSRALVAYRGLGALPPEEATYFSYYTDTNKEQLDGKNNYRIHLEKAQLPPAQAFWSYTIYGEDRYLVDNPIRRYAIGDRNDLKYNEDGSLDIYLANKQPEGDKVNNWLPIPNDKFNVTLRIYIPDVEALNNKAVWKNPSPEKID
ncbi:DUF1254 domain-containing protein [Viscerimonas tarda]